MPFRAKTLPPDVPLATYIESYPYPAFVLNIRVEGKHAASLIPIFTNKPFRLLAFGPARAEEPQNISGGGLLEIIPGGPGFEGIRAARQLGEWIEAEGADAEPSYELNVEPPWLPKDHPVVRVRLVKTSLRPFWIIIAVPLTPLPDYEAIAARSRENSAARSLIREASTNLRLSDLPLPWTPVDDPKPHVVNPLIQKPNVRWRTAGDVMIEYMNNFPWENHPMGPIDKWAQSLRTVISIVMGSSYPCALWWGPELVLIYNDAYAVMSGSKHPHLFGKSGKIAWGELWEELGPISDIVYEKQQSVAFEDERMFFGRLTDRMLPEEVYHSWSWIPVRIEDGSIGGFLNIDFESTSKILYERRIRILRQLGDKTAIARSKREFAEATQKVLEEHAHYDMPFVAFYFNSVEAPPKATHHETGKPMKPTYVRVTSRLAYKIGVPDGHIAIPDKTLHVLDATTLRPVTHAPPTAVTKRIGATPDSSVDTVILADEGAAPTPGSVEEDKGSLGSEASNTLHAQWPFFDIFSAKKPLHVQELPSTVGKGFGYRARGWNDIPREAVVIPVASEGDDVPVAVMVVGLNTRRPYDKEYRTWIELLYVSLSSTLTATLGREAEMKKAEQLAQLDAAKTSFFSSASHELRTPLTLIAGPVSDALNIVSESKAKELLKLSVRNIARLQRLVDSLMDFSRLEAGRLLGRFRATNVASFTADLASLFRAPIEKQGIEYRITTDTTNEGVVYLDHDLWEKIVFNIIGNAFKYTLSGHVHVHVRYRPPHAEFIVTDTGVGIPPEEKERIFERFHRVSATARSHEGTGIGLALTRELVKIHGGHISLESALEDKEHPDDSHGTTFVVHIPLGNDHLSMAHIDEDAPHAAITQRAYARGIVEEANQWGSIKRLLQNDSTTPSESVSSELTSSDSTRGGDLAGMFRFSPEDTILIVDDNTDIRRFLRTIFRPYCKVVEAGSAPEGLTIMEAQQPNLVLSDVMMPGMDGIQFVAAIRDRPQIAWTPIILLTARAGDEARVEGLLSGADDYIGKPFKSQELIARVHLHMQLGKRKLELQKLFDARTKEIKILSDMSPVGIFRTDDQGQVTYTNRRWHELTDYPANQPFTDWILNVHPDFQKDVLGLTSRVLGSEGASLEIRWRNERWTKLEMQRIAKGLIGTVTDVSDRHLYEAVQIAQAKEREALAQLRAADAERQRAAADERRRAQELLVDVTSHELRQPVSAIINCSQIVRSNLGNLATALRNVGNSPFWPTKELLTIIEEDLDALDSIYQCGLSQERIANDVLSLSRMQLETLSIQSVDFQVVEELKRIVSIFSNELKMKHIGLDIKIGDSVGLLGVKNVSADRTRFAQIVTNLMSNAIKFTDISPASDRRIIVYLDLSLEAPSPNEYTPPPLNTAHIPSLKRQATTPGASVYVYVSVQDSGPGLKPGDLALLFQRFQQGSNSHEVFGGSGLGLFVSRKLCDLMSGAIGVDSVFGQGATFRFYIKVKTSGASKPPPTRSTPPRLPRPQLAAAPIGPTSQMAFHILITEDNVINQTVLNRQLKQAGFTTELASNGRQAIDRIKRLASGSGNINPSLPRRFDVILMDCEMPELDGLSATREIRRMEADGALPLRNRIIALTGNAREGQVQAALNSGMDDVMIKPYKLDELLEKIRLRALMD